MDYILPLLFPRYLKEDIKAKGRNFQCKMTFNRMGNVQISYDASEGGGFAQTIKSAVMCGGGLAKSSYNFIVGEKA